MPNLDRHPTAWKEDVLTTASDRFERRLSEEAGKLRAEVAREAAAIRVELAATRVDIFRWCFAFLMAQLAAQVAIATFLFHAITR